MFKKEHVEEIAEERLTICRQNTCNSYDEKGETEKVVVKGFESCGDCGCNLSLKTRSLSSECPKGLWLKFMSEQDEVLFNASINKK
jgi:hypothetical protein